MTELAKEFVINKSDSDFWQLADANECAFLVVADTYQDVEIVRHESQDDDLFGKAWHVIASNNFHLGWAHGETEDDAWNDFYGQVWRNSAAWFGNDWFCYTVNGHRETLRDMIDDLDAEDLEDFLQLPMVRVLDEVGGLTPEAHQPARWRPVKQGGRK